MAALLLPAYIEAVAPRSRNEVDEPPQAIGSGYMHRNVYLATLLLLQVALIGCVAPPLARMLPLVTAPGLAPGGWPATLQLLATAATIAGASVALAFPVIALARHRRSGPQRFLGLPVWATVLASFGIAALAAGSTALALVSALPADARMTAVLVARPLVAGGVAMAAAGVLCAELLRRSVTPARESADRRRSKPGRVEVTHPPELRTQVARPELVHALREGHR
jgi:hypothetical protein